MTKTPVPRRGFLLPTQFEADILSGCEGLFAFFLMTRWIFFDLDGTLADTAPDLIAAANKMRTDRGMSAIPEAQLRPLAGHGTRSLVLAALGVRDDQPEFAAMRSEFLANYAAATVVRTQLFPGIASLLQALKDSGLRQAIVTNKPEALAHRVVDGLAMQHSVEFVLGCDSPGCTFKPKPDSILKGLEIAGIGMQDALYVGDESSDVLAAHAAGIPCALVRWGYRQTPLEPLGPDFIAENPEHLLQWCKNFKHA